MAARERLQEFPGQVPQKKKKIVSEEKAAEVVAVKTQKKPKSKVSPFVVLQARVQYTQTLQNNETKKKVKSVIHRALCVQPHVCIGENVFVYCSLFYS